MRRPQLLNVKQVAAYLQLQESTVYTWAQQGKIPAVKIGRTWRFSQAALDAWLVAQTQPVVDTDGEIGGGRSLHDKGQAKPPEAIPEPTAEDEPVPTAVPDDRQEKAPPSTHPASEPRDATKKRTGCGKLAFSLTLAACACVLGILMLLSG